jgi:hypothetical protein
MKLKHLMIIILFLLGTLTTFAGPAQLSGKGAFMISGDRSVSYDSASARISFMKAIKIWHITLSTPYDYKKKNGSGFMVNLFFSRKFSPQTGTFPIKFSYLNEPDTLGGSLMVTGEKRGMFSHDTDGKITFKSFGDTVSGEFEMTALKKRRGQEDEKVTIKGSFTCPRGDAFK